MILDTYHDRQNGFIFGTTPVGLQYDAQVRNEGETQSTGSPTLGRSGGGSGGGLNVNWDGSWDVKTRISETGWTAEFMIPLRTLRYGPPPQSVGRQFRAVHRTETRAGVLVAGGAGVQHHAVVVGRRTARPERRRPAQPEVDAVCHRLDQPELHAGIEDRLCPSSNDACNTPWGIDAKIGVTTS